MIIKMFEILLKTALFVIELSILLVFLNCYKKKELSIEVLKNKLYHLLMFMIDNPKIIKSLKLHFANDNFSVHLIFFNNFNKNCSGIIGEESAITHVSSLHYCFFSSILFLLLKSFQVQVLHQYVFQIHTFHKISMEKYMFVRFSFCHCYDFNPVFWKYYVIYRFYFRFCFIIYFFVANNPVQQSTNFCMVKYKYQVSVLCCRISPCLNKHFCE